MATSNPSSLIERLGGVYFQETLDKFGVLQAEQRELRAIVDDTRAGIVV
jgi:hypothetical protein